MGSHTLHERNSFSRQRRLTQVLLGIGIGETHRVDEVGDDVPTIQTIGEEANDDVEGSGDVHHS